VRHAISLRFLNFLNNTQQLDRDMYQYLLARSAQDCCVILWFLLNLTLFQSAEVLQISSIFFNRLKLNTSKYVQILHIATHFYRAFCSHTHCDQQPPWISASCLYCKLFGARILLFVKYTVQKGSNVHISVRGYQDINI